MDFFYECHVCKAKIEAFFDKPLGNMMAIDQGKNTYVFRCADCSSKLNDFKDKVQQKTSP